MNELTRHQAQRFIKALLNLCLDHGIIVDGLGVENYGHIEAMDKSVLYSILYDHASKRFAIEPMSSIYHIHAHFPDAFVWSQEYTG